MTPLMSIANVLPPREFRDIQVKVHIRRPEKDSWAYLGRALVTQEVVGQSSRVGECRVICKMILNHIPM